MDNTFLKEVVNVTDRKHVTVISQVDYSSTQFPGLAYVIPRAQE